MPRICPHCRHVRKEDEVAPDWQCPSCQRAYAKEGPGPEGRVGGMRIVRHESAGGSLMKWPLILIVIGIAVWFSRPALLGANKPESGRDGQPEVVLYATSWCGYCAATRDFFQENRIEYIELDVEKSEIARNAHRELGGGGVPVIMVGDQVIHGFNQPELRRALGPWLKGS